MTLSQLPLLIGLLVALAIVLLAIARQLRAGATLSPVKEARQQAFPTPIASPTLATGASAPKRVAAALPAASGASAVQARPGTGVASWGYQLQNLDLDNAGHSPFDMLVIDTTLDGSDATALKPTDLARLQRKSDGSRRLVLAYLSIGEAESYRSYWNTQWKRTKPEWLLGENPDWKENYAVCFWHPGWQAIMCGTPEARLDKIIAAGFDGVYLDKCDVFDDLKRRFKAQAAGRPDIEADMVQFIGALSAYAKAKKPGFQVVMQNAEDLLERDALRASLDGVAKEELVYGGDGPEKLNSKSDLQASRELLDRMRADGKMVLVVEYLNDRNKINHAMEVVGPLGYVLYVSDKNRDLKRLNYELVTA